MPVRKARAAHGTQARARDARKEPREDGSAVREERTRSAGSSQDTPPALDIKHGRVERNRQPVPDISPPERDAGDAEQEQELGSVRRPVEPELAPVELSPAAVVELAQLAIATTVQVAALVYGVDASKVEKLGELSPGERGALIAMAPAAAPFASRWMGQAPMAAAAGFAVFLGALAFARVRAIGKMADTEAKPEKHERKGEPWASDSYAHAQTNAEVPPALSRIGGS